jgi:hypothetical protein
MKKYIFYSGLSGCVWAAIALGIGYWIAGSIIFGGIALAPVIGIGMGLIFLPAYRLSELWQFFLSFITLGLAGTLFGLGMGFYNAFERNIANRDSNAVVIESVLATLTGILYMFFFFWPLSYLNHRLLSRVNPKYPAEQMQ